MTTEVLSQTITAGQQATFGQGRIFYIKTAAAALTFTAVKQGTAASIRKFIGIGAGFKFTAQPGDGWDYLRVDSASTQAIELILSDDDVEVANAVSVTGSVSTQAAPTTTATDRAPLSVSNAIQTVALFAANATRRKLRVFVDENNQDVCYAHTTGGTNRIANLQPGSVYTFDGLYGLDVERAAASGGNCIFYIFEES